MIINCERIVLETAGFEDKRMIYDMLVNEDLKHLMFSEQYPAPTWEEFSSEVEAFLYDGVLNKGNYLLIKCNQEVIGSISYCCVDDNCQIVELDIWFGAAKHTGHGFGVEAINYLTDYLHQYHGVHTFLFRPWCKNYRALRAYHKAGFREIEDFYAEEFYSDDFLDWYADGDYGAETVNLIKEYK